MLERAFEILVRSCACDIFPADWELAAQQLSLPCGRLDLLYIDGDGRRHVLELKKGQARPESVNQALRYASDLAHLLDGSSVVVPWVVAHDVPDAVARHAEAAGVRTHGLSASECEELIRRHGLGEAELLGTRRARGVLHGGSGGIQRPVDNDVAYRAMPAVMVTVLRELEESQHFQVRSGGMQTVVHYRGVKLGGVNRQHRGGVGYISEGVVLQAASAQQLEQLGFRRMTKTQSGSSHEHVWWEISSSQADAFGQAIKHAQGVVNRALRLRMPS